MTLINLASGLCASSSSGSILSTVTAQFAQRVQTSPDYLEVNYEGLRHANMSEALRAPCLTAFESAMRDPSSETIVAAAFQLGDTQQELYIQYLEQITGNRSDRTMGAAVQRLDSNNLIRSMVGDDSTLPYTQVLLYADSILKGQLIQRGRSTEQVAQEASSIKEFSKYKRIARAAMRVYGGEDLLCQDDNYGFLPRVTLCGLLELFDPDQHIGIYLDHSPTPADKAYELREKAILMLCNSSTAHTVHGNKQPAAVVEDHDWGHIFDWALMRPELRSDLGNIAGRMEKIVATYSELTSQDVAAIVESVMDGPLPTQETRESVALAYKQFIYHIGLYIVSRLEKNSVAESDRIRIVKDLAADISAKFKEHPQAIAIRDGASIIHHSTVYR